MEIRSINGDDLKKMIISGANNLQKYKEEVDRLNVFPVPDGDTGTNMSLTVLSASKEVGKVHLNNITEVVKAAANGSLRGARGNSGVILSQLFRGFSKGLENKDIVNTFDLAHAFQKGAETAYKAVMKPKEGTILTVAREIGEKAVQISSKYEDIVEFLEKVIQHGNEVLKKTPEMLPVLKQAGVVDAGGKGLLYILEGAYKALIGKEVTSLESEKTEKKQQNTNVFAEFNTEDITFGYCTEFIINTKNVKNELLEQLKEYLETIGDSIVVVGDEELIKIHVHTDHPGQALEKAITIGSLSNMKIENMREQHTHNLIKYEEGVSDVPEKKIEPTRESITKPYGFIAVSAGEGLIHIFKELGVDVIIHGGQTMNPSTEDFLNAIEKVPSDTVFILPNNKNIILAAEQAQELSSKKVIVIPTKTIPQGLNSMIYFDINKSLEENEQNMRESLSLVKTGQVTFAVRDTTIDEIEIHTGDIMGILEDSIKIVTKDTMDTTKKLINEMVDEESEIIAIYYGQEVSLEDAQKLKAEIEEKFDFCDVELHDGGQPLYYYLISVE